MENLSWVDEPRTTVRTEADDVGTLRIVGVETADQDRANVFGVWLDFDEDEDDPYDIEGSYRAASSKSRVSIEAEVRFAWFDCADIEDHAEVYVWHIYHWKLGPDGPECTRDQTFGGDFLVESSGLAGPEAMFSPLVGAGVRRIRDARWNKIAFEPHEVGV